GPVEPPPRELPIGTEIAGVIMRLTPGGIRELHWHKEAEWAYVIAGSCRVSLLDELGRLFIDDGSVGDPGSSPPGPPPSVPPRRAPPPDPGARRRRRVPARLRQRRLLGERDLPDHRLVRPH